MNCEGTGQISVGPHGWDDSRKRTGHCAVCAEIVPVTSARLQAKAHESKDTSKPRAFKVLASAQLEVHRRIMGTSERPKIFVSTVLMDWYEGLGKRDRGMVDGWLRTTAVEYGTLVPIVVEQTDKDS